MILFANNEDLSLDVPEDMNSDVSYKEAAGTNQSSLRVVQPPQIQEGGGNPMAKVFDLLGHMQGASKGTDKGLNWKTGDSYGKGSDSNGGSNNSTKPMFNNMNEIQQAGNKSYRQPVSTISPAGLNRQEREAKYSNAQAMPLSPAGASEYAQSNKPAGNIMYEAAGKDYSTPSMVQAGDTTRSVTADPVNMSANGLVSHDLEGAKIIHQNVSSLYGEPPSQGVKLLHIKGKRAIMYPDGSILVGGTRSWRTHNPGNIIYTKKTLSRYKALGGDHKGDTVEKNWQALVFSSNSEGAKARADVLKRHYSKNTIWTLGRRYQIGQTAKQYGNNIVKGLPKGFDTNKKIGDMTSKELSQLAKAQAMAEGYRAGTVILPY